MSRKPGSWMATSPQGCVIELYDPRNVAKVRARGWRIETAMMYLGRINREIRQGGHVTVVGCKKGPQ